MIPMLRTKVGSTPLKVVIMLVEGRCQVCSVRLSGYRPAGQYVTMAYCSCCDAARVLLVPIPKPMGPPQLGQTASEIYRRWELSRPGPSQIVVGVLGGVGVFSSLRGQIVKHELVANGVVVYRPVTLAELSEIDWAIEHGCFQIETRPVDVTRGQNGVGTMAQSSPLAGTIVLHQATGEWLRKGENS